MDHVFPNMPKDTQGEGEQKVDGNTLFEMGIVKEDLLKMYELEHEKLTHIDTNQYLQIIEHMEKLYEEN